MEKEKHTDVEECSTCGKAQRKEKREVKGWWRRQQKRGIRAVYITPSIDRSCQGKANHSSE